MATVSGFVVLQGDPGCHLREFLSRSFRWVHHGDSPRKGLGKERAWVHSGSALVERVDLARQCLHLLPAKYDLETDTTVITGGATRYEAVLNGFSM